jgi:hypothetical protein
MAVTLADAAGAAEAPGPAAMRPEEATDSGAAPKLPATGPDPVPDPDPPEELSEKDPRSSGAPELPEPPVRAKVDGYARCEGDSGGAAAAAATAMVAGGSGAAEAERRAEREWRDCCCSELMSERF